MSSKSGYIQAVENLEGRSKHSFDIVAYKFSYIFVTAD
jgi:hypothetical protein